MDADLDLLLIAVYCTADDLLPARAENARRILTDAEVVTLCVAQQLLGIGSDEKFWATVPWRLGHLFPRLIARPGFVKRRQRLSDTIEALILEFARHSPGSEDDLLVVDSTQWSAAGRLRRCAAARWEMPPTTATAPVTPATSGASGCTACSRSTAPHGPWR